MNNLFIPKFFTFQWHITERCNWRCRHCYQNENISPDLSLENLFHIFDQFLFLIKKWRIHPQRVILNMTGGEPFIRKDFFQLLERIGKHSHLYRWGILTNGSLLNEENLKKLKELNVGHIQVSLEGMEKNNDKISGKGTFKSTLEILKILEKAGIFSRVSLTLTKKNIKDVLPLVELLDKLGVGCLGTRRLIPYGRGKELEGFMLQPQELRKFYLKIREINRELLEHERRLRVVIGCDSGIFNEDLLFESSFSMQPNVCGVPLGRCLAVMANGDVFPCRRLPLVMGNLLKDNIDDVYYSKKMQELRNLNRIHPFCRGCSNFSNCFGGARCVNYTRTGKWDIPDVQCWRAYKKINKPLFKDGKAL